METRIGTTSGKTSSQESHDDDDSETDSRRNRRSPCTAAQHHGQTHPRPYIAPPLDIVTSKSTRVVSEESDDESGLSSVVVQSRMDMPSRRSSGSIKARQYVQLQRRRDRRDLSVCSGSTDSSSCSETESERSTEESVWAPFCRPCRVRLPSSLLKRTERFFRCEQVILWDIIYPSSTFRTRWDLYMLLLFAYICIVSPYIICFGIEFSATSTLGVFELLINLSFGLDILLNFRTAYVGKDG